MSKILKDSKKAIWPQFPITCGVFALHDLGHDFKGVGNVLSLQLPKCLGRQRHPFGIVKDFNTMIKIRVFTHEKDPFDDIFLQKNTFKEVQHMAQILFDQECLQEFDNYMIRRLSRVPLDQLIIEPMRDPTLSASIDGDSKEKSKENSRNESIEKYVNRFEKTSKNQHNKSEELIKYIAQSIAKSDQQSSLVKQVEASTSLTKQAKLLVIDLEEEWENFNRDSTQRNKSQSHQQTNKKRPQKM